MSIRISATICTHNRSSYLGKAIRSLVDQTLPSDQYEVIVVDNASTDDTRAVFDSFAGNHNLRYILEPVLGLSQARNTGWQNARGEYVAYLDDDAIACPEWLERIVKAFETVWPTPAAVGGKVVPIWGSQRPGWLPKEAEPSLSIIDWADRPVFLTEDYQFLGGGNIAYARTTLQTVNGFSSELGRKGGRLVSGEETLIERRLRRQGLPFYYDPLISIEHHIHVERLTTSWLCRRYFWTGASFQVIYLIESGSEPSRGHYLGQALWSLGGLVRSPVSVLSLILPIKWGPLVRARCSGYFRLGTIWCQLQIALGQMKGRY